MSLAHMTIAATPDTAEATLAPARRRRISLASLGLVLPVTLAVLWELVVWSGWSDGRLVPPPSVIFATLWDLAKTGELWRHAQATVLRVAAGFGLGVVAGTLLGAIAGYSTLS